VIKTPLADRQTDGQRDAASGDYGNRKAKEADYGGHGG
jgi:hypothetical protein